MRFGRNYFVYYNYVTPKIEECEYKAVIYFVTYIKYIHYRANYFSFFFSVTVYVIEVLMPPQNLLCSILSAFNMNIRNRKTLSSMLGLIKVIKLPLLKQATWHNCFWQTGVKFTYCHFDKFKYHYKIKRPQPTGVHNKLEQNIRSR